MHWSLVCIEMPEDLFCKDQVLQAESWDELIRACRLEKPYCTLSPPLPITLNLVAVSLNSIEDVRCMLTQKCNLLELELIMAAITFRLECMRREILAQEEALLKKAALEEALMQADPHDESGVATVKVLSKALEVHMSQRKRSRE